MEINKEKTGESLILQIVGRLDTTTAPQLEALAQEELPNAKEVILNFENLDYVSSAGLRVLLAMQKTMNRNGSMVIKNVKEEIMEVFEMTGFSDILTIQK